MVYMFGVKRSKMELLSYFVRNRFGIFYFRIVFPKLVRDILFKKETRKSLRTHDRKIAVQMYIGLGCWQVSKRGCRQFPGYFRKVDNQLS